MAATAGETLELSFSSPEMTPGTRNKLMKYLGLNSLELFRHVEDYYTMQNGHQEENYAISS